MRTPTSVASVPQMKLAALAVMSCFASSALANPTGGVPVAGTVSMSTPAANVLEITNSPNSIIHWQGFSIHAGEVTRFLQNSPTSAVLNRVVSNSPSDILGTLYSNGRVFLINPNGIVFGGGAVVDVAGLVASSLNLSDADFMAGNYRFQPVPGAGSVVNGGVITTHAGGQVYLVGPAVSNGGVITSPQGEVILAAGNSVELMNTGTPGLSVSIEAPANEALNLGQIYADSGRVGIFAGLINQRGLVSAGTAVVGVDGSIRLQATESTVFAGASNTYAMGALDIDTGDLTVAGYVQTGPQTIDVRRGMIVQNEPGVFTSLFASGGQTINAGFVEVNGVAGGQATIANTDGLQSISTFSTNASGNGLVVRSAGGTGADISNAFGDQRIQIHNAQRAMIDGATGFAAVGNSGGGMQTFSLSGPGANALVVRSAPGGNAQLTAFGGQTIDAGYVDVTAVGGNANIVGIGGDQRINTTAANAAGEGLVVRNLGGGFASIVSDGGEQHIDVRNADRAVVDGALSFAEISNFGGAQTISLTGSRANALALGSPGAQGSSHIVSNAVPGSTQTVSTTGALTVLGGTAPGGSSAGIRSNSVNGQQTVRAGSIRLQGGSSGSGNIAVIEAASGSQKIDVGLGGITLMGGAAGANNFVQINQRSTAETATQTVHSAGPVLVQGGDDGNFNFALIRAFGGHQELAFGNTTLLAGASGIDNFSVILGRDQDITVHGNLALVARGSAGGPNIGGVRIGGIGGGGLGPTPTDLQIHVDGDFSMTAGSVAGTGTLLGNTTNFTGTTDISVHAGGKVSLSGGTAADTYSVIGSRAGNLAGGGISITAGGDIALDSTAPDRASIIRTADGVTLTAQQITQGPDARIQAGSLNTNTSFGADLDGTNAIGAFSAVNWAAGDVVLHNTSPLLTVTGVQNFGGGLSLQQAGDLLVNGTVSSGPQTIDVSGGLHFQNQPGVFTQLSALGGQTIDAGYVEVTALDGGGASISNSGGIQSITTSTTNALGEGLVVRNNGGFVATIDSFMGEQHIHVRDADRVLLDGASGPAQIVNIDGVQTVALTGAGANALVLGTPGGLGQSVIGGGGFQSVLAGGPGEQGSITLHGLSGSGFGNTLIVSNQVPGGSQSVSTTGTISVLGGAAPAGPGAAGIFANGIDGQQTVSAGSIVLQGGSTGSGNSAMIGANNGSQTISVGTGGITLRGGAAGGNNFAMINQLSTNPAYTQAVQSTGPVLLEGGAGNFNFAMIRAFGGHQGLTLGDTTLLAGAGGIDNFAVIQGRSQDMTVHGDLALVARGSAGSPTIGGGARIGGVGGAAPSTTSLRLNVDGDFTMTAGSVSGTGTLLGNTTGFTGTTDISLNVGGDVALNGGTAPNTFATIGSRASNVAGGEVAISALGNIALNSSAPDAAAIVRTTAGVSLAAQQITQGADARIEAGSLAVDTAQGASLVGDNAVDTLSASNMFSGDVTFNNTSDLLTVTQALNIPGAISLQQAGDLLVNGTVSSGPQTIDVTGGLIVQNEPFGFAQLAAQGGQTINAGYVEVEAVAGGGASIFNFGGEQRITTISSNAAGEGLAVRAFDGGFASIDSPTGPQAIAVHNADRLSIDAISGLATINAFGGGTQTILLTGTGANSLELRGSDVFGGAHMSGNNQTVRAGNPGESGSISLWGGAGGFNASIFASPTSGGSQDVATSGALAVIGGTGPTGFDSGIFAEGMQGQQIVNAESIVLRGGSEGAGNGAVIFGNTLAQSVTAGTGGILVAGGTGNNTDAAIVANSGSQAVQAGAAGITLQGGDSGGGNGAVVIANAGSQTVKAGTGGITLIGGDSGSSNLAQINQVSTNPAVTQTVVSAGPVHLRGGSGNLNFAMIRSFGGHQSLSLGETSMLSGAAGVDNFTSIQGRVQDMVVHGDLTMTARGSAGTARIGGGARIGGVGGTAPSPTELALAVEGDLTMTAGSLDGIGTLIGSFPHEATPNDIDLNVWGNVTLNGGTAPNTISRIGAAQASDAGGDIGITAGGTIALNSTAPGVAAVIRTGDGVALTARDITQGADSRIEAGTLTVETAQGASLGGANSVSGLAMLNTTSGNVAFNNASALLTVTGIDQVDDGALHLNQVGNLLISGDVTSGAQSINATGDMTITPGASPNVTVQAHGPQTFNVGGSFSLLGGTAWNGYAQTLAQGPVSISTGADLNVRGGSGLLAYALLYGGDGIRLTVGDELHVDGGSGLLAFARVQTDFREKIFLDFPNRASGGYFVNGREGVTVQGLDGFFTGLLPARRGRSLIVSYGE